MPLTESDKRWITKQLDDFLVTLMTHIKALETGGERVTIDKEAWERGVRDGFATGRRGIVPDNLDPYSYWRGFIEGEAARHGDEGITADVAEMCRLTSPPADRPLP